MPLNVDESPDQQEPPSGVPPEPVAPPPSAGGGARRAAVLWVLLLVAAASGVFLAIQFGIFSAGNGPEEGMPRADEAASTESTVTPSAPQQGVDQSKGAAKTLGGSDEGVPERGGEYTIFISAFSNENDAAELAGRWKEAGYNAFIQHASGWYRVGLGRYGTVISARQEADRLRQAFEEGYWIGRADL